MAHLIFFALLLFAVGLTSSMPLSEPNATMLSSLSSLILNDIETDNLGFYLLVILLPLTVLSIMVYGSIVGARKIYKFIISTLIEAYHNHPLVSVPIDNSNPQSPFSWGKVKFPIEEDNGGVLNGDKIFVNNNWVMHLFNSAVIYKGYLIDPNGPQKSCTCNEKPTNKCLSNHIKLRIVVKRLTFGEGQRANFDLQRFVSEAKLASTFDSTFLTRIHGVVSEIERPLLVVYQYYEKGTLRDFLRFLIEEVGSPSYHAREIQFDVRRVEMAIHIADGMHFLHSKGIIHRDLAARNVMVDACLNVKIGDFGITCETYPNDYHRESDSGLLLPLRWMSPESIQDLTYTPASNVWSYGILLWELLTFAQQPYADTEDNNEVKSRILRRELLPQPEEHFYLEPIWKVITTCWHEQPKLRPNFGQIVNMLYSHLPEPYLGFFNHYSHYISNKPTCHCGSQRLTLWRRHVCAECERYRDSSGGRYYRANYDSNPSTLDSLLDNPVPIWPEWFIRLNTRLGRYSTGSPRTTFTDLAPNSNATDSDSEELEQVIIDSPDETNDSPPDSNFNKNSTEPDTIGSLNPTNDLPPGSNSNSNKLVEGVTTGTLPNLPKDQDLDSTAVNEGTDKASVESADVDVRNQSAQETTQVNVNIDTAETDKDGEVCDTNEIADDSTLVDSESEKLVKRD